MDEYIGSVRDCYLVSPSLIYYQRIFFLIIFPAAVLRSRLNLLESAV